MRAARLKLLVADDSEVILSLVGLVAEHQDLDFIPARNGLEALELFKSMDPDVVLTDFNMPGLNGLELCREIKSLLASRFVPIVMMTASSENAVREQALELGVIEFLPKPLQPSELSCRLTTLSELSRLHKGLERYKEDAQQELALAKHILGKVVHREQKAFPDHIRMETVETLRANGDLCIYRTGHSGNDRGLVCDATGHGLASGICTLPMAETFLSMACRDFPLETILYEANAKLLARLPMERFVCALAFDLDASEGKLSVLNAGLPDAILIRRDGSLKAFPSVLPPAGICAWERRELQCEVVKVEAGDRFFAFTDGLSDLYSEEAIPRDFLTPHRGKAFPEHVLAVEAAMQRLTDDLEATDDISWALVEVPPKPTLTLQTKTTPTPAERDLELPVFQTTARINPKRFDVASFIPRLIRYLEDQGLDETKCGTLALVMSEAITNALDHGILRLDSALKAQGFEVYEAARQVNQEALRVGEVGLDIRLNGTGPLHDLQVTSADIRVWDSGPGFDWEAALKAPEGDAPLPSGRGLPIIQSISTQMAFTPPGNQIAFRLEFE